MIVADCPAPPESEIAAAAPVLGDAAELGQRADVHRALPEDPVLVEQALDVVEQLGEARDPGADVLGKAGRHVPRHAARAEALEPGRSPKRTWQPLEPEVKEVPEDASNHTI